MTKTKTLGDEMKVLVSCNSSVQVPKDCAITVSHCTATLQQSKYPQATMKQGHGPSEQGHGPGRWLHPTVAAPVLVPHPPAALLISVSHNASSIDGNSSCFVDGNAPAAPLSSPVPVGQWTGMLSRPLGLRTWECSGSRQIPHPPAALSVPLLASDALIRAHSVRQRQ